MSTDTHESDDADDADETERIGTEPIDGDGGYPFAGLTRYDDDVDAMMLPENVWSQQSSMRYWAQNEVHGFDPDGEAGVDRDLDPSVLPERGLNTMIPDIPAAAEWPVAIMNPRTNEVMRTLKHKAVVNRNNCEQVMMAYGNHAEVAADLFDVDEDAVAGSIEDKYAGNVDDPVRTALREFLSDDQIEEVFDVTTGDDTLFTIPTQSYTIINPPQFLRSLVEVLQDRDLGDKAFGELRLSRGGGRGTLDVFFDGNHVDVPMFDDGRPPIVVGLEIQWDFFGDWMVRACGTGFDWNCTNAIRRLTDREGVKHTGDVESRQDWVEFWNGLLDGTEEKVDQLARVIQMASETELDFSDLPDDIDAEIPDRIEDARPWAALYYYSGLPAYLSEHAGRYLRTDSEDPYNPNWWEIHSAATRAITHDGRGSMDSGGAIEDYARVANDMLMNPPVFEGVIVEQYEADRTQPDGTLVDEGQGGAQIQNAFESTHERREQFEEWQSEVQQMVAAANDGGGEAETETESEGGDDE